MISSGLHPVDSRDHHMPEEVVVSKASHFQEVGNHFIRVFIGPFTVTRSFTMFTDSHPRVEEAAAAVEESIALHSFIHS